jgi:hypothetical protein
MKCISRIKMRNDPHNTLPLYSSSLLSFMHLLYSSNLSQKQGQQHAHTTIEIRTLHNTQAHEHCTFFFELRAATEFILLAVPDIFRFPELNVRAWAF